MESSIEGITHRTDPASTYTRTVPTTSVYAAWADEWGVWASAGGTRCRVRRSRWRTADWMGWRSEGEEGVVVRLTVLRIHDYLACIVNSSAATGILLSGAGFSQSGTMKDQWCIIEKGGRTDLIPRH
jgi:hypothetical protein